MSRLQSLGTQPLLYRRGDLVGVLWENKKSYNYLTIREGHLIEVHPLSELSGSSADQ